MNFKQFLNRKTLSYLLLAAAAALLGFGAGIDYLTGKPFSIGVAQKWSLILGGLLALWLMLLVFFGKEDVLQSLKIQTTYRPEIDGLRAIAVLAVLFFHAGWKKFAGGYVGVDVFFVISGYLITRLILIDIQQRKFSLARFYERRVRRIFPALFVVIAAVLVFGWFFYHAKTFLPVSKSAFAAITSWANFQFWSEAGYWDSPSAAKPLLHTWSLSVEEQFYLAYPLFLYLTSKYLKNWIREALWIVWIGSLTWSAWAVSNGMASDAFYMPQFRVWELATGGLLLFYPLELKGALAHIGGVLGLAAIGYAVLQFSRNTPFPGFAALLPVLGSAVIIMAGKNAVTGKLLSLPPFTFVGKISYSLYLWHWPILVFTQYVAITELGWLDKGGLLLISVLVSTLSWKFVEEPFRKSKDLQRRWIFTSAAVSAMLVGGLFWAASATDGLPFRYASKNIVSVKVYNQGHLDYKSCFPANRKDIGCPLGTPDIPEFFVITGDSHAYSIGPGFDFAADKIGEAGWLVSKSSCSPMIGTDQYFDQNDELDFCYSVTAETLEYINERPEVTTLVMAAKWSRDYFSTPFNLNVDVDALKKDHPEMANEKTSEAVFKLNMRSIIDIVSGEGKKVVLVLPVPEPRYDVPAAYTVGKLTGRDVLPIISVDLKDHYTKNKRIIEFFEQLRDEYPNVTLFDPAEYLCGQKICQPIQGNMPLYIDDNHLSTAGARLLLDPLAELLTSLK